MKVLLAVALTLSVSSLTLSNAEDLNAVNTKLINSMITVSSEQFSRANAYINQYNSASLNLTLVAGRIMSYPTLGVIDLTPLQNFIQDIQATLNSNVQELTVKFSPSNVQSFILGYYQTFLTNLLINNETSGNITAMNLVYYGKILSPNATVCYDRYNNQYSTIYASAAGNFTQTVESQVASTVTTLDSLKTEIETLITGLVKSFEDMIDDQSFASIGTFIATNTPTLGSKVVGWVTEFSGVMRQIQQSIKDGFNKFDSQRVNDTLRVVEETLNCLNAA